ncbi:FAD-dependent monooxygenase [Prauserella flavalba]|uniref:3-hydroxybenzoate 6-hydroxylase n=1 Tax=Prauserella flavalba TaxID=1477506 RepID=A0A318LL93_9PSEU|nr:FAD-dependent monooxygenase [Prauserella flavalba]PXY33966.1 3-hydroxybenzoate 6-hydroxylase [Prauserella flavalba]
MTDRTDTDVAVVGGGIGGLANALALASSGHRVRVLERAPAFAEVGAGLQLAPNATRILREWGLLDEVIEHGVRPGRLVFKDALDGAELTSLELGGSFERRYGAPYVVIHRSDLLSILFRACERAGVELLADHKVDDVIVAEDEAVVVAKGEKHRAAIALAADGLWSPLRGRVSDDSPVCSGYVAYRGALPVSEVTDVDADALTDVVVHFGPGCHLVQYPLRQGEMLNTVAVFASPAYARGEEEWGGPGELDAAFDGTCPAVQRGLAWLWRDRRWPMFDRLPIGNWVDGRLALTGDAAHPMLQYLAQGACQALEDAHCLAAEAGKREGDWAGALEAYQRIRTARTARVQSSARVWGEIWHCDGLTRTLRNALLTDRRLDDYQYVDWLYQS